MEVTEKPSQAEGENAQKKRPSRMAVESNEGNIWILNQLFPTAGISEVTPDSSA